MLGLMACVPAEPELPSGREDFLAFCAACHGTSARGDGEMARELPRAPADLTGLSRRAGGAFPMTKVMAKIWGYTGGRGGAAVMPNFGPLLESAPVPFDGGDGIQTPTPIRLVQIAEYLKSVQAP